MDEKSPQHHCIRGGCGTEVFQGDAFLSLEIGGYSFYGVGTVHSIDRIWCNTHTASSKHQRGNNLLYAVMKVNRAAITSFLGRQQTKARAMFYQMRHVIITLWVFFFLLWHFIKTLTVKGGSYTMHSLHDCIGWCEVKRANCVPFGVHMNSFIR